jgi:hypothetical protein
MVLDVGVASASLEVALAVSFVAVPVLVLLGFPPSWITASRLQSVIIVYRDIEREIWSRLTCV